MKRKEKRQELADQYNQLFLGVEQDRAVQERADMNPHKPRVVRSITTYSTPYVPEKIPSAS